MTATASTTRLIGNEAAVHRFVTAIEKGRASGTYLLVGPSGVGKATFAQLVAKSLLCQRPISTLEPCGNCPACQQVDANSHPDLIRVRKPDDKAYIPLELLIGPPEARLQEGFCRDIHLKPSQGDRKLAILDDADYLNEEGANCLLKTLEEPPASAIIFLIGTNEQRQLPTIRSRCRIVRLQAPSGDDAKRLLSVHGVECTVEEAEEAIRLCGGDIQAAAMALTGDSKQFRDELKQQLSRKFIPVVELAKTTTQYVDDAGESAQLRRDKLRELFAVAASIFHDQLAVASQNGAGIETFVYRIERTIEAINQVYRNANQTTLIEAWAADIARGHEV